MEQLNYSLNQYNNFHPIYNIKLLNGTVIDVRLMNYLYLKEYEKVNKRTFYPPIEKYFKITANDLKFINQYYNVIPRLAPDTIPHIISNMKPNINFHNPIITNKKYVDSAKINDAINPDNFNICTNNSDRGTCDYINDCMINTNTFKKSLGYDQPGDHYFNYIDTDYQQCYHTDMWFSRGGISTRLNNKINKKDFQTIN